MRKVNIMREAIKALQEYMEEWFGDEYAYFFYFHEDEKKKTIEFYKSLYRDACRYSLSPRVCMRFFESGLNAILEKYGFKKVGVRSLKVKKSALEKLKRYGFNTEGIEKIKVIRYRYMGDVKNE